MFDQLQNILSKVEADYADLRYEVLKETKITFKGKELSSLSRNSTDGFLLRVLREGGLSSVSFSREKDAENAIEEAQENALLLSRKGGRKVELKKTERIEDEFYPSLKEDPRSISLEEKLDLLRNYNSIPLSHEGIATTQIGYFEVIREKYFLSSEGTKIREDLVTSGIKGLIISGGGSILQNVVVAAGGSQGFHILRQRDDLFQERTKIALDLLKAKPIEGGTYRVILNPDLAGEFTHEAFGHFSEADIIEDVPSIRERMKLGESLGSEILNIVDDPTMPDQLGFYGYDDEGVRARRVQLMKNGVLTGRLHSRRTAASFGEPLTGHAVAEDYRYPPIVRMGNTYIEPQKDSLDDLLRKLGDGLYILGLKGGETSGENFTFGAQYGYKIEGGKIKEMIRDLNISGNLYQTLKKIEAVGNDLELGQIGGCLKGQLNIRSSMGAPHILIDGVVVGGI